MENSTLVIILKAVGGIAFLILAAITVWQGIKLCLKGNQSEPNTIKFGKVEFTTSSVGTFIIATSLIWGWLGYQLFDVHLKEQQSIDPSINSGIESIEVESAADTIGLDNQYYYVEVDSAG